MVDVLYALIAMIAMLVVAVLLRFNKESQEEEAKSFRILMWTIEAFCFVDSVWGFIASQYISSKPGHLYAVTVLFYLLASYCALVWCKFTFHYLRMKRRIWLDCLMISPFLVSVVLVILNNWNSCIFYITDDMVYHTGTLRVIPFVIEGYYFVMALIFAIITQSKTQDAFRKKVCYSVETFCVIPIVFLILQIMFPESPYISSGYMVASIAVFLGIVSAERTQRVVVASEHYKEESKEIYMALEGIAKSFVSVHLFDLTLNKQTPVYSNRFIDEYIDPADGADVQITKVMQGVVEPEYVNKVVDFVDLKTLSVRMRGKRVISCEFMGRNQGWCIATFIKIAQDERGNVTKVIHAVQNMNEVKMRELEYEKALAEAYEDQNVIYSEMLKMQAGGVIATDEAELILAMNDSAAKMFGYPSADVATADFHILLDKMEFDNYEEAKEDYNRFKGNGEGFPYYFKTKNYKGNEIYVMGLPKMITGVNGRKIIVTSYTDISVSKEMENKLVEMSETDALTGIYNRGSGESKTEAMLSHGAVGLFCLIDIDQFKKINDSFGHMVGDKALIAVAKALKTSFRDKDVVMRLGGDEFAVFAEGITTETAARRCFDRFFDCLEKIKIEEMKDSKITVSLGAAFATRLGEGAFDDMYQRADAIMYGCKEKPGNCYAFTLDE